LYLCKKNSGLSYKEIGARFGDRDHSTVIYAIKQIEKRSLVNKDIRKDISNLNKLLV
jgi:chromosomal replication initiator protein